MLDRRKRGPQDRGKGACNSFLTIGERQKGVNFRTRWASASPDRLRRQGVTPCRDYTHLTGDTFKRYIQRDEAERRTTVRPRARD